jgi:hypothetical protein
MHPRLLAVQVDHRQRVGAAVGEASHLPAGVREVSGHLGECQQRRARVVHGRHQSSPLKRDVVVLGPLRGRKIRAAFPRAPPRGASSPRPPDVHRRETRHRLPRAEEVVQRDAPLRRRQGVIRRA